MAPRSTAPTRGPSLTAVTSRRALPATCSLPSETVNCNGTSSPLKFSAGWKVQLPSPLSLILPAASSTLTAVTARASPSISLAWASSSSALKVIAVSSAVAPRSTCPTLAGVFSRTTGSAAGVSTTTSTSVSTSVVTPSPDMKNFTARGPPAKSAAGRKVQVLSPLSNTVPDAGSTRRSLRSAIRCARSGSRSTAVSSTGIDVSASQTSSSSITGAGSTEASTSASPVPKRACRPASADRSSTGRDSRAGRAASATTTPSPSPPCRSALADFSIKMFWSDSSSCSGAPCAARSSWSFRRLSGFLPIAKRRSVDRSLSLSPLLLILFTLH